MSELTAIVTQSAPAPKRLSLPASVRKDKVLWPYFVGIVGFHVLALLALVPWLFSWTGVALALCGLYVFGTLGINLCYHRLLTHKGFVLPKWLEHTFAVFGVCCLQDTPARWVAVHRLHHQHSDDREDPHSPLVSFFWGHFGWLMVTNQELQRLSMYERYSRDILRDRFYLNLERHGMWLWINLAHWLVFFGAGFGIGWVTSGAGPAGAAMAGVQFGLSLLVWGVFVRTVLVWHITWSVNSVTHLWGYRTYETDEQSRNNILVGILSNGEGWHNNHHADPRSAAHGHRWWEFDVTYLTIKLLAVLGVACQVVMPNPRIAARHAGPLVTRDVQDMGE